MSSSAVILMPNIHRNAQPITELLARQDFYASYLRRYSGTQFRKPLVIISGANNISNFENIEVHSISSKPTNVLVFSLKSLQVIKGILPNPSSLVAGTPFQPFLIALILKLFIPKTKIHTAIHGEIGALKRGGLSNLLKLSFLRLFLRRAHSVRFVSRKQAEDAKTFVELNRVKTFIAPVPYIADSAGSNKLNSSSLIAFVGRIQHERGVEEWMEVVEPFGREQLMIIGEGPLAQTMKTILLGATFTGALTNKEVQGRWAEIGVLLSTAPYESYGLAMREALLHGVPVVSKENAGAIELEQRYPNLIKLYRTKDRAQQYLKGFLEKPLGKKEFDVFRKDFFAEQEESLIHLAKVWLNEV